MALLLANGRIASRGARAAPRDAISQRPFYVMSPAMRRFASARSRPRLGLRDRRGVHGSDAHDLHDHALVLGHVVVDAVLRLEDERAGGHWRGGVRVVRPRILARR